MWKFKYNVYDLLFKSCCIGLVIWKEKSENKIYWKIEFYSMCSKIIYVWQQIYKLNLNFFIKKIFINMFVNNKNGLFTH